MTEPDSAAANERPPPAAWSNNPFQAPTAHVEDARPEGDGNLLDQPNRVGAGQGIAWWSGGWSLFREATGLWIGISITYTIVVILLGQIPVVGSLTSPLLMPLISGGLMLGCRSLQGGDGLSFSHLFAGFQKNAGQLFLVGVLNLVGATVIVLAVAVLIFGGSIGAALTGKGFSSVPVVSTMIIGVLLGFALFIPLVMSIWFAPALVVLNDLRAIQAMKLSFKGCLRNLLPILVYAIMGVVLAIVASIPLGLGWLLLIPTKTCSTYVAYREIFIDQDQ